jgi:hypothetical protein
MEARGVTWRQVSGGRRRGGEASEDRERRSGELMGTSSFSVLASTMGRPSSLCDPTCRARSVAPASWMQAVRPISI